MFVRREALEKVGPLDEGYFLHCEDLDWCERFRRAGFEVLFVPDVTVVHDKGTSSRGRPVRVLWHMHRGMVAAEVLPTGVPAAPLLGSNRWGLAAFHDARHGRIVEAGGRPCPRPLNQGTCRGRSW
jgi:GT2 family glycosyltransferase